MKIKQKSQFQPITLTLENSEEAEVIWAFIDGREDKLDSASEELLDSLRNSLSNWFSQNAQMSGR